MSKYIQIFPFKFSDPTLEDVSTLIARTTNMFTTATGPSEISVSSGREKPDSRHTGSSTTRASSVASANSQEDSVRDQRRYNNTVAFLESRSMIQIAKLRLECLELNKVVNTD